MAIMYPETISVDTESDAERLLYALFRDKLGQDYTVFHSVAWQSLDSQRKPRDGEADFVIAHPQNGILVLEVKGGTIEHDPKTGRWMQTSRSGYSKQLQQSPFAQAKRSRYFLKDWLVDNLGLKVRQANIGHAVAFPDVMITDPLMGPDAPREIIMDQTDLANVSGCVGRTLAHYRGQEAKQGSAPGAAMVEALIELLGCTKRFRPVLWGDIVQERNKIDELTEEQFTVLNVLNHQRRAAICGCAGSGKTMLALEKATRLAKAGFRVLLTCFNRNLAAYLRSKVTKIPSLDVYPFLSLCEELVREAGCAPPKPLETDKQGTCDYYDYLLPEALLNAVDTLDVRYDAIIVDEGQDFRDNYWIPLQTLLHDPDEGILYIFYDDNQRLYVRQNEFPIKTPPYLLSVNCRNTQHIHRLVCQFYQGEQQPIARGPTGQPPEVIRYDGFDELLRCVREKLNDLVFEDHVPTDEIVVLSTHSAKTSRLCKSGLPSGLSWTDSWPAQAGQIVFLSIHSFKGLESPVILLVEVDDSLEKYHTLDQLIYVGCSRACHRLIAFLSRDAKPELAAAFEATRD